MKSKAWMVRIFLLIILMTAVGYRFYMRREPLAVRLISVDDSKRNMAIDELAKLDDQKKAEVVTALIASASTPDPRSRRFAIYALRKVGGTRVDVMKVMVGALSDTNAPVREEAMMSLNGYGAAALPSLFEVLKNPRDPAVPEALKVMEKSGEKAVPGMIALLSEKAEVQLIALHALKKIGKPAKPAEPAILTLLASNDASMRLEAAEALVAIDALPAKAASRFEKDILSAKESYTDPAASKPRLARLLEKTSPRRRELVDLGFDLLQKNPTVRYRAALYLSEMNPPTVGPLEMLVDALNDKDVTVAARALHALTRIGLEKTERLKKTAAPRIHAVVKRAEQANIEGFKEIVEPKLALPN